MARLRTSSLQLLRAPPVRESEKKEHEHSGSESVFSPPPVSAVQAQSVKLSLQCLTCFGKRREVSGPEYFLLAPTCYIYKEKKGGGERGERGVA